MNGTGLGKSEETLSSGSGVGAAFPQPLDNPPGKPIVLRSSGRGRVDHTVHSAHYYENGGIRLDSARSGINDNNNPEWGSVVVAVGRCSCRCSAPVTPAEGRE